VLVTADSQYLLHYCIENYLIDEFSSDIQCITVLMNGVPEIRVTDQRVLGDPSTYGPQDQRWNKREMLAAKMDKFLAVSAKYVGYVTAV